MKRILALSPHTDDAEFGCGGTLARYAEAKAQVYVASFSAADDTKEDIIWAEALKSSLILGVRSVRPRGEYKRRELPLHRQEILEDMLTLKRQIRPQMIFLPSPNDTHQDHQTIAQEGFRAFKDCTILGYELPWNNLTFRTNAFVYLKKRHTEKRIGAVQCYKSQLDRIYANGDFITSLAKTRGVQIGTRYAESFEVIRWTIK